MKRLRNWIAGFTVAALLAVGVVALAGNGFGSNDQTADARQNAAANCALHKRDADGDGILNADDPDWVRPMDGTGHGAGRSYGQGFSGDRLLDGSGFGGHGAGAGTGLRDGSCI